MAVRFLVRWLAVVCLLSAGLAGVAAEEFRTPSISAVRVEWRAALDQFHTEIAPRPAIASRFSFAPQRRVPASDPRAMPALVQLNAINANIFAGIGRSPVPVLLPFDTAGYLDDQADGTPLPLSRYQADFRPADMFHAGLAGYDAVFSLPPGAGAGLPSRIFDRPVEVQITGSILVYDLADPLGGKGEPVKALAAQYPDMRRFIREGYVRYAFTRFGVPYVVSIQCLDSTPRPRRLACREAYPVAERFLKALARRGRTVLGAAHGHSVRDRRTPGGGFARLHLLPRRRHHRPQQRTPAWRTRRLHRLFANPFSAGESPGRHPLAILRRKKCGGGPRRLSVARQFLRSPQLPGRAMRRRFRPSGPGHPPRALPAEQQQRKPCHPRKQAVVAVRDGVLIRSSKQQAATLQINTSNEHIRFRYMHMNPSAMDADGILNGRRVAEGEKIGVVSNYLDFPERDFATICTSTFRCSRATAGSGSIPTPP